MKITKTTFFNATLDDWAEEFWGIYQVSDLKRNLHQVWAMAYEDATRVGEAIRENNFKNCITYLAHTFCWIASFVKKLEEDKNVPEKFILPEFKYKLSRIVWYKYPKVCPHCLKKSCVCPVRRRKPSLTRRKAYLAKQREQTDHPETMTMDHWQAMLQKIYDKAHFIRSLDELGFHLLEEMGEVEEVIRRIATWTKWKREKLHEKDLPELKETLIEEVADTISWCFSIVRKIASDAERSQKLETTFSRKRSTVITPKLQLSRVLWQVYKRKGYNDIGCPVCGQRPCVLGIKGDEEIRWILEKKPL